MIPATCTSGSSWLDHSQVWTPGAEEFHKTSFDLNDTEHSSVMTELNSQLIGLQLFAVLQCFQTDESSQEQTIHTFHALYIHWLEFPPTLARGGANLSLTESGSWRPLRWASSLAGAAGCYTQETAERWGKLRALMFDPLASPGWSGQMGAGSEEQARCWAAGWCGLRTRRRGFQKTAPSWTLVSETPKQLPHHRDSRPERSWRRRGTHSRILKRRRDESVDRDTVLLPWLLLEREVGFSGAPLWEN